MLEPRWVAYDTVDKMMEIGLEKHADESWREEPKAMHIQKAIRHATTALLLLEHPDYCQDAETALEHLERALCRVAFALSDINMRNGNG